MHLRCSCSLVTHPVGNEATRLRLSATFALDLMSDSFKAGGLTRHTPPPRKQMIDQLESTRSTTAADRVLCHKQALPFGGPAKRRRAG